MAPNVRHHAAHNITAVLQRDLACLVDMAALALDICLLVMGTAEKAGKPLGA